MFWSSVALWRIHSKQAVSCPDKPTPIQAIGRARWFHLQKLVPSKLKFKPQHLSEQMDSVVEQMSPRVDLGTSPCVWCPKGVLGGG